jgi:hypothetical protein
MENPPHPSGQEPDPILDAIQDLMGTMGRPSTDQVEYLGRDMLGLNSVPDSANVDPKLVADQERAAAVVRDSAEKFNSGNPTEVAEASRMFKLMLDASKARDEGRLDSFDPNSHDRFLEDPLSGAEVREGLGAIAGMLKGDLAEVVREHIGLSTAAPNTRGGAMVFEDDEHGVAALIISTWAGMGDKVEQDKKLITPGLLIGGERAQQTIMQAVLEDDRFASGSRAQKREIVERVCEKLPFVLQAAIQLQRAKKAHFKKQMDEL